MHQNVDERLADARIPTRSTPAAPPTRSRSSAPSTSGESQYYLLTEQGQGRQAARRRATYRLRVPGERAGHPVLVDDRLRPRHARLHPDAERVGRSSQIPGLQKNADGSVDIYFGPTAPGGQGVELGPDRPQRPFEVLARFYGPQKPLFDKTWKLPDIGPNRVTMKAGWISTQRHPATGGAAERATPRTLHTPTSGFMDHSIAGSTKPAAEQRHRLWFQRQAEPLTSRPEAGSTARSPSAAECWGLRQASKCHWAGN